MLIYRDGSVQVNHGGTEMGQGLHTKIRQIAARRAGRAARIDAHHADAHRQGAEHVGHRGLRQHRSEWRGRGGCLRADCGTRLAPVAAELMLDCHAADVRFRRRHGHADDGACAQYSFRGGGGSRRIAQRMPLFAQGYYRTPGIHFDSEDRPRAAVPLLRVRRGGVRSGGRRLHGRAPHAARRSSGGRGRFRLAADRSRPDRRRLRAGRGLAHAGRAALGRAGPPRDGRRVHLQAAVVVGAAARSSTWLFWSAPPSRA